MVETGMVKEGRVDNQLEDGRVVVQKKATKSLDSGSTFRADLIGEQESTAPQHQKGVPLAGKEEEKESKEWNDLDECRDTRASRAVTRSRPRPALAIFPGVIASVSRPLLEPRIRSEE